MTLAVRDRSALLVAYVLVCLASAEYAFGQPSMPNTGLALVIAFGVLAVATTWRRAAPHLGPLPSIVAMTVVAPLAAVALTKPPGSGPQAVVVRLETGVSVVRDLASPLGPDVLASMSLVLASVGVAALVWELTARVPRGRRHDTARFAAGALALGAIVVAVASAYYRPISSDTATVGPTALWWALASLGLIIAAAAAIVSAREGTVAGPTRRTSAIGYLGITAAVCAAGFALTVPWWPLVVVPAMGMATTLLGVGRLAVGPLEVEAEETRRQRDLVVSTQEAERRRIAGDLHDGPLGDMAALIHVLDRDGNAAAAKFARFIASDLRSVSNELCVPMLEDLGAGPALDWLAKRVSDRTRVPIIATVDDDSTRPPRMVELAFFRVAQEGLLNAVRHGRGPVRMHYQADPGAASLTITDVGPGMDMAAASAATRNGHVGLALMAQRAEAIGAELRIESVRGRGARVDLEWAAAS